MDVRAYPTDAKERERNRKNAIKAAGGEIKVKKTKKIVEDHYDDCGDDLSSLELSSSDTVNILSGFDWKEPCDFDTDEELLEDSFNYHVRLCVEHSCPVDVSKIAKPQPLPEGVTELPRGKDPRAPKPIRLSTCKACAFGRLKGDWTHTREIGQCEYPYHPAVLPPCEGCQTHAGRDTGKHSLVEGECRLATKNPRQWAPRIRGQREVHPRAHESPTARLPGTIRGRELGQDAEEAVQRNDDRVAQALAKAKAKAKASAAKPKKGRARTHPLEAYS